MKDQDKIKTKKDVLEFIEAYIYYRGGLGTRINAYDIREFLQGMRKRDYKKIKKKFEESQKIKKSFWDKW